MESDGHELVSNKWVKKQNAVRRSGEEGDGES